MKKSLLFIFLSLFSFVAMAQDVVSSVRYPVFERVYEPSTQVCHEVIEERRHNTGGAVLGAVIGYVIGREIDRDSRRHYRGYVGGYGYHPHRGGYYNDRLGGYHSGTYESRVGRYGGAVAGAVIGSNSGSRTRVTQVCESQENGFYREVLVGHRVVVRFRDGTSREHFERIR